MCQTIKPMHPCPWCGGQTGTKAPPEEARIGFSLHGNQWIVEQAPPDWLQEHPTPR